MAYDFPTGDMQILQTSAAPFGNRVRVDLPPGGMDDPYSVIGGNPHPIATSRETKTITMELAGCRRDMALFSLKFKTAILPSTIRSTREHGKSVLGM